jgi:flagellar protein FliS
VISTPTAARNRFVADGVASTTNERLLVLLFERMLRDLDEGAAAIGRKDIGAAHEAIVHAQDIVSELQLAIDPDSFEGADGLVQLYVWLGAQLLKANLQKDPIALAEARQVAAQLHQTWSEAYEATRQQAPARPATEGLDIAG